MKINRVTQFVRRPASALWVLLGILVIHFALIQATDTGRMREENLLSRSIPSEVMEERIAAFRRDFDLDRPIYVRFGKWLGNLIQGDFGHSMTDPRPVSAIVGEALSRSLWLQVPTIILFFLVGIPLGIFMASHHGGWIDRILNSSLLGLYALPTFWVATLLLIYGATDAGLGWFPLEGLSTVDGPALEGFAFIKDRSVHLFLPLLALALPGVTIIAQQTRSAMLETLSSDFVLTARAAGISERDVIWRHSIRHAIYPAATLLGLLIPQLVGGSVVVESIFNIGGMGNLLWQSAQTRDFPVLQTLIFLSAVLTLAGFVFSDYLASRLMRQAGAR
ncbi:MAG: peptide/nickel transport system permease protein [Planctomycetota bacterium]